MYDGDPIWNEVEIGFENQDYYNMGFLKLSGAEKIIPVDGQHRVEGIKEAIRKNKSLEDETISVILLDIIIHLKESRKQEEFFLP